jgi:hypothetical protein
VNLQLFPKNKYPPEPLFPIKKKENRSDAIEHGKPVPVKNYLADLPASYSTRTGAIVFVAIDRRTRIVSFRQ